MAKNNSQNRYLRAGELARLAGVSTDTLRHYERKGLLAPRRSPNGYREYPPLAADRIRMIRGALAIGFRLDDLSRIIKVRDAGGAPCREVRALAQRKFDELETLVREMTAMRDELRSLLKAWDRQLDAAADGEPARLLESLAATCLANAETRLPLKPPSSNRKPKKERK